MPSSAAGVKPGTWHDLPDSSRLDAAQQVQEIVLAQLAALSHSMLEFGCGAERTEGFLRRMGVRYQVGKEGREQLLLHIGERGRSGSSSSSK